jgi:hypothetical protein
MQENGLTAGVSHGVRAPDSRPMVAERPLTHQGKKVTIITWTPKTIGSIVPLRGLKIHSFGGVTIGSVGEGGGHGAMTRRPEVVRSRSRDGFAPHWARFCLLAPSALAGLPPQPHSYGGKPRPQGAVDFSGGGFPSSNGGYNSTRGSGVRKHGGPCHALGGTEPVKLIFLVFSVVFCGFDEKVPTACSLWSDAAVQLKRTIRWLCERGLGSHVPNGGIAQSVRATAS